MFLSNSKSLEICGVVEYLLKIEFFAFVCEISAPACCIMQCTSISYHETRYLTRRIDSQPPQILYIVLIANDTLNKLRLRTQICRPRDQTPEKGQNIPKIEDLDPSIPRDLFSPPHPCSILNIHVQFKSTSFIFVMKCC